MIGGSTRIIRSFFAERFNSHEGMILKLVRWGVLIGSFSFALITGIILYIDYDLLRDPEAGGSGFSIISTTPISFITNVFIISVIVTSPVLNLLSIGEMPKAHKN